ncbi:MAG TPA: hypothetical protein VGC57_08200 [Cellulomonas sp.]
MSTVAQIGVVLAALVVSALVGWLLTALVLRLADRSGPARAPTTPTAPTTPADGTAEVPAPEGGPDGPGARDRLRGGTWIGVLERVAVTGTLLAGEPSGIAVVVAVKGLGRYPELRSGDSPGVSERFVIGTLTSLVWSAGVGLLGRWLLTR